MIAKIYKLPAGLTSPDDKPDKQLWDVLISSSTYSSSIEAQTVSAPDLDTITVQTGGLGDMQTQQLYLSNFINVGTFGYQITNIYYAQQTNNGVYMVEGKLDIYYSFLVSFFDETSTNSNRVYVHQKHLNRYIIAQTVEEFGEATTISTDTYLMPQVQQYLLNKHPTLKDIGKQLVKSYHLLNPSLYQQPSSIENEGINTWGYTNVNGGGTQPQQVEVEISAGNWDVTDGQWYEPYNYFQYTSGSSAYPVLIIKADTNSNDTSQYYAGLFPYFLCDWGPTWSGTTVNLTVQLVNNPNQLNSYSTNINYPYTPSDIITFTPLFNIASDYYAGLYLFPIPVLYLQGNGNGANEIDGNQYVWNPLSNVLSQGLFQNGKAYEPNFPGTSDYLYGSQDGLNTVGEGIANQIKNSNGALCNLMCAYADGNTFYGIPNSTMSPVNKTWINSNNSTIEPAVLNGMSFNVRLYGQDNLVRPLDFNYGISAEILIDNNGNVQTTTTSTTAMDSLFCYLNYFAITVSPPNVMITNIPYHDLTYNIFRHSGGVPSGIPQFGAFNGYNDVIFSAMMKSEVPTPSTAGTNYIANSKNNYDMGLNISNLLAQNAQAEVQVARNNMGIAIANEITGLGSAVGDFFSGRGGAMAGAIGGLASGGVSIANAAIDANTIAPNNADIQEMRYHYMAAGKQQDMSRTTSMRVSATATTNTLNDTVYTVIDEVPPMYEQVYVVNYYALNGYIVNKGDLGKYGFNRKICNFISCSFFTNAMLPNLNINGKTKIDALLNKGFRVGCYNNNQTVQLNETTTGTIDGTTVPYNVVLYNLTADGAYIYNNEEVNPTTDGTYEVYYLYKGTHATNSTIQAGVNKEIAPKHEKTKSSIQNTEKNKSK